MNIAILLDGDFSRRLLFKKLGHWPSPGEIEVFCRTTITPEEVISATYYYDCPPFSKTKQLPVSKVTFDFSQSTVHRRAEEFQKAMQRNHFFSISAWSFIVRWMDPERRCHSESHTITKSFDGSGFRAGTFSKSG